MTDTGKVPADVWDNGRLGGMEDAGDGPVPLPVQAMKARRRAPLWEATFAAVLGAAVRLDLPKASKLRLAMEYADAALDARDEA